MNNLRLMSIVMILIMSVVLSCGHDSPKSTVAPTQEVSGAQGTIRFNISFASPKNGVGKIAATEAIDTVTAYVYNESNTELLEEDLTISEGRATGKLTVVALNNLRVVLAYFDGPIVQYIGQDDDVDVLFGGETQADIVEYYMGVTVDAPDTAFVGEKYTVSWDANTFAVKYELQESSTVIYNDVNIYTIIEPKTAEGTFHYRVRISSPFGYGPWYTNGAATTGVYIREGDINIDVPIPPDDINEINFVTVPAGSFQMGAADRTDDQKPVHTVSISEFEMSIYEITNIQYSTFLNAALASGDITATSDKVDGAKGDYIGKEYIRLSGEYSTIVKCWIDYENGVFSVVSGREFQPVIYVSWYGAKAFAEYYGLDLPTEAEWEYAARGGQQYNYGTDGGTINISNACYNINPPRYPIDVGAYAPNPYGLHDMTGNAWEWCNDWYYTDYYSTSPASNPTGPSTGTYRINRGCGWDTRETSQLYVTYRKTDLPITVSTNIGFRVVRR